MEDEGVQSPQTFLRKHEDRNAFKKVLMTDQNDQNSSLR